MLLDNFTAFGITPVGFLLKENSSSRPWVSKEFPEAAVDSDLQCLIDKVNPDISVVATPLSSHHQLALASVQKGLHTFVEKPLCRSRKDLLELIDYAAREDVSLFTGYVYLYHPAIFYLSSLLIPEKISDIVFYWSRPGLIGSLFWELLPHEISLALKICGGPIFFQSCNRSDDVLTFSFTDHHGISIRGILERVSDSKQKSVFIKMVDGTQFSWVDNKLLISDRNGFVFSRIFFRENISVSNEISLFLSSCFESSAFGSENLYISSSVSEMLSYIDEIT